MMEKMKELYEKVAKDSVLQAKLAEIMNGAEKDGQEVTGTKLVSFSKDAGYDVTLEEIQDFFKSLSEKKDEELSDSELDMVAGGKLDLPKVLNSISTSGTGCVVGSMTSQIMQGDCMKYFQQ